ncbi:MAG: hypothetical protein CMJ18_27025 [Phycisphaeraceae bacterium]|nr:hypothetical protein [Phycisphaeraceae bacterium]
MTDACSAHVALVDSGVKRDHPHVADGDVTFGPTIAPDGRAVDEPQLDLLGHGTATCAAILDLAPATRVTSIRVFHDVADCPYENVLRGLELAIVMEPDLVNLGLGTASIQWRDRLEAIVAQAVDVGVRIVAPASFRGLPSWPGCLPGVEGVLVDPDCPRERPRGEERDGRHFWFASPWPRELPGLSRERNLHGDSFAVANVVGYLARSLATERDASG